MDGSQSVHRVISVEREIELSRIEPELWSQAYQRLISVNIAPAMREKTPVETVVDEPQAVRGLVSVV